jgi:hypothetical protein
MFMYVSCILYVVFISTNDANIYIFYFNSIYIEDDTNVSKHVGVIII